MVEAAERIISGGCVAKKRDIREVEAIANEFGMDPEQRRDFGDYLEECKRAGDVGTKNEADDFTWDELKEKAREFLGPSGNP